MVARFFCLWIERKFLGLGFAKKKIVFRFVFLSSLIWVRVLVFFMFFPKTNEFFFFNIFLI